MIRRVSPLLALVLISTGCTNQLGRATPQCDEIVTTAIVMEIQAVPTAAFVPCLESLPVGWEYNHLEARSGLTEFTLDSDRMGDAFVLIRTTESCDIDGAEEIPSDDPDMRLYTDVRADLEVPVVFVPEGPTDATIDATQAIVTRLIGRTIEGREIAVRIDRKEGPTADRIRAAQREGAHVFVIGLREAEEGTVTVSIAGRPGEVTTDVESALEMIEEVTAPPSLLGSWYHVFDGGCIEYRFDAHGPDTHTLEQRISQSLGFIDSQLVADIGRSFGYEL